MPTITVDSKTQRFDSDPQPEPDVVVIHTTEGMSWPSYAGGGQAPHSTIKPLPGKGIEVREHIDLDCFGKALMNLPGGVETNRRGAVQLELMGTCDPKHKGDDDWYFWPDADDVVLQALADYLRPIVEKYDIPCEAPEFYPYPKSYGNKNGQRMSGSEWVNFHGFCGHQHVPENDHGDPGQFPIEKLFDFLGGGKVSKVTKKKAAPAAPKTVWGKGDKGAKVKEIQKLVGVTADGIFGPATEAALRSWQSARGLDADGLWGPACEGAKKTAPKKASSPAVKVPPFIGLTRYGNQGIRVRKVQARLQARGWKVTIDGIFGRNTESVVKAFQKEKGLTPDGIVGPKTWEALWAEPVT